MSRFWSHELLTLMTRLPLTEMNLKDFEMSANIVDFHTSYLNIFICFRIFSCTHYPALAELLLIKN
jgi:hypothetical protein